MDAYFPFYASTCIHGSCIHGNTWEMDTCAYTGNVLPISNLFVQEIY